MLIIADKPGQLGNMLFVHANLIASAMENNLVVANPVFEDYADLFPSTCKDLLSRFPAAQSRIACTPRRRKLISEAFRNAARVLAGLHLELPWLRQITLLDWNEQLHLSDPKFLAALRPNQHVLLRGWLFRDAPALKKHAAAVRDFFRPHDENQRRIDELIAQARRNSDVLIGVHIRHGIIHFANTRKYFYTAKRYAEMMDDLTRLFPSKRVSFLICSDWPQDANVFERFDVTFGTADLIEDMYALASCDYLIGAPSTFTMWASFYNDVPLNVIRSADQQMALADFVVH